MDDCCAVCAETLEWTGYGHCGHLQTCSKCVARLRFVLQDKRCAICQQECDIVFFTRYAGEFTQKLPPEAFQTLRNQPEFTYLSVINGYFDNIEQFKSIKTLCSYTHPAVHTDDATNIRFRTLKEMKVYIKTNLGKQFCEICLKNRKVFLCDQLLYAPDEMKRHMGKGDIEGPLAEGGFKGHPMCEFCRSRFFSDAELFRHNSERHETCFVCRRNNPTVYRYFRDYTSLEVHFREQHHPCQHPECLEKHFIVFGSETELRRHVMVEHERKDTVSASRSQRREALTIETNFRFSRPAIRGRRGRGRFHLDARHEYNIDGLPEVDQEPANVAGNQRVQLTDADFPEFVSSATAPQPKWHVTGHRSATSLREESFPSLPGQSNTSAPTVLNTGSGRTTMAKRLAAKAAPTKKPPVVHPLPNPNLRVVSQIRNSASTPHLRAEENSTQEQTNSWVTLSKKNTQDDFPTLGNRPQNTDLLGTSWGSQLQTQQRQERRKTEPVNKKTTTLTDRTAFPTLGGSLQSPGPSTNVATSATTKVSESFRALNKTLIKKLKDQMDSETFKEFHKQSEIFLKDGFAAEIFHKHLVTHGLAHYIAEIATICPNASKRSELLDTHGAFIEQCKESPEIAPIFVPVNVLEKAYKRALERPPWTCLKCSMLNSPDADYCEFCDASNQGENSNLTTGSFRDRSYRRVSRSQTLFGVENGREIHKPPWGSQNRPL